MWPREMNFQLTGIFIVHFTSRQCLAQQIDDFSNLGYAFGRILALAVTALNSTTSEEAGRHCACQTLLKHIASTTQASVLSNTLDYK
jgi:hypothetical protein